MDPTDNRLKLARRHRFGRLGRNRPCGNEIDCDLLAALNESAGRLCMEIERHRALVNEALQDDLDPDRLQAVTAGCPRRTREEKLKTAIQQAIEVIEASRRAFKSKQLEALRKHLTQVLIDAR